MGAYDESMNVHQELAQARAQLEKVGPLVDAVHRISTNDGRGEYGDLHLDEMRQIAREALAAFRLSWTPRSAG